MTKDPSTRLGTWSWIEQAQKDLVESLEIEGYPAWACIAMLEGVIRELSTRSHKESHIIEEADKWRRDA